MCVPVLTSEKKIVLPSALLRRAPMCKKIAGFLLKPSYDSKLKKLLGIFPIKEKI